MSQLEWSTCWTKGLDMLEEQTKYKDASKEPMRKSMMALVRACV